MNENGNHRTPNPQAWSEVLGVYQDLIVPFRDTAVATTVETLLGLSTKNERSTCLMALEAYVTNIATGVDGYLAKTYLDFPDEIEPDTLEAYRTAHKADDAIQLATDAVETEITNFHRSLIETRTERSLPQSISERLRALKHAKLMGNLATKLSAGTVSYLAVKVESQVVDDDNAVKLTLLALAAYGVGKIVVPAVARSVTEKIMGSRVEKLLRPIPPEVEIALAKTDEKRKKLGQKPMTHEEKVKKIRAYEIHEKTDDLHDHLQTEVRDWTQLKDPSVVPDREVAVQLIRSAVLAHLCVEYGLPHDIQIANVEDEA